MRAYLPARLPWVQLVRWAWITWRLLGVLLVGRVVVRTVFVPLPVAPQSVKLDHCRWVHLGVWLPIVVAFLISGGGMARQALGAVVPMAPVQRGLLDWSSFVTGDGVPLGAWPLGATRGVVVPAVHTVLSVLVALSWVSQAELWLGLSRVDEGRPFVWAMVLLAPLLVRGSSVVRVRRWTV